MDVEGTIKRRRSIRRFLQKKVRKKDLEKLVEAARLAPSSANLQPLRFLIIDNKQLVHKVTATVTWAKYLGEKGAPPKDRGPTAYIIVLADSTVASNHFEHDTGLAVENILLMATALGLGSCCIGGVNKARLRELLDIPKRYIIDLVVAIGYAAESPVVEEASDSVEYWRDQEDRLHVPKRRLEDIIYWNKMKR